MDDGEGEYYRGQDGYSLSIGALHASVTSSSSTIRFDENTTGTYGLATYDDGDSIDTEDRFYLEDSTFFVGIDNATATSENNSSLDVSTATGTMAAKISSHNLKVFVIFRDGDSDAAFVVYAAGNLEGGASSEDVVYLADDAVNTVGSGNYEVNLYFMADMTLVEDVVVDDDYKQGFYAYEVDEDGVYTLTTDEVEFIDDDVNDDTDDEADESVAFVEVYNYLASTVSSGYFDAISFADAVVIDTRSTSEKNASLYSGDIESVSALSSAINRGTITADVFVEDGEIVFVAVTDSARDTSTPGSTGGGADTITANLTANSLTISNAKVQDGTENYAFGSATMTVVVQKVSDSTYLNVGTYTGTVAGSGTDSCVISGSVTMPNLPTGDYWLTVTISNNTIGTLEVYEGFATVT